MMKCEMCDDTGFKDYAGYCMEPCDCCVGDGVIGDDPEVRGSVRDCPKCNGTGKELTTEEKYLIFKKLGNGQK